MNSLDPFGIARAGLDVWRAYLEHPDAFLQAQQRFTESWFEIASRTIARMGGEQTEPVVAPAPSDKRFSDPAWTENPFLDATKQAYLLATEAILGAIDAAPAVEPAVKRRARFFARQFTDAMNPAHIPWVNPAVVAETVRTGGQNLARGMQNLVEDIRENEGRVELVDKHAFELGKNIAVTPGSVVFRNDLIELIQYAPTTAKVYEKPLVIFPPWINKYYVLDLQPANSFVKFATDQGFTTFIVSWRNPTAEHRALTFDDYVTQGTDAACRAAAAICGTKDVNVIGYCIGGTLVAMYVAYLAAKNDALVNAVTSFASLVDFSDPGEVVNFLGHKGVEYVESHMAREGTLPGRAMADVFNLLRANDLIWTVAVNRYLLGKKAPMFDLLFWNSDATRMPEAMHSYYLRNMYVDNNLIRSGALQVRGTPLDLKKITSDWYAVASIDDHIAPWQSVYSITQLTGGSSTFRLANSGHIAGIINPPGKPKASWWGAEGANATKNPPAPQAWLEAAPKHEGSWWGDWTSWLAKRSGEQVDARTPGSASGYAVLEAAPGSYVRDA